MANAGRHDWLLRAWQRRGWLSTLLLPAAALTGAVVRWRRGRAQRSPPAGVGVPVIVVGNLVTGGTGKTPVVMALIDGLRDLGWQPGVISRGYGVKVGAQPRCGQGALSAQAFGDEPALIARTTGAPLAVHPRRRDAALALLAAYPHVDIIVSDDGLQHWALARDLDIVVQDARGLGNGRLLPAGPLREPADRLTRVDGVINHRAADDPPTAAAPPSGPALMVTMQLHPHTVRHVVSGKTLPWHDWLKQHGRQSVAAAAAIGQPARFFAMLRGAGAQLGQTLPLPDHAAMHPSPFGQLHAEHILITPKDAVKCDGLNDARLWAVQAVPAFSPPDWVATLAARIARPGRGGTLQLPVLPTDPPPWTNACSTSSSAP